MPLSRAFKTALVGLLSLTTSILPACAQTTTVTTPLPTSSTTDGSNTSGSSTISRSPAATNGPAPDVYLNVPELSVGRISLEVDNLQADINLNARVGGGLVVLNAGVNVQIETVNITITNVEAELELVVRLGNLVEIVNRVFESLDLNPLLLETISGVTDVLDTVIGEVDGLLGSITQGGNTIQFLIDNLGNIVQRVNDGVDTIIGDFQTNMTDTGTVQQLSNGLTSRQFEYEPLDSVVNIVFNQAGQVVRATVDRSGSPTAGSAGSTSSAAPTLSATGSIPTSTSSAL